MDGERITKKIGRIKFGLVSPGLVKKIGTVNIITPELYDADGYPVEKGLMDPSMGIIDPGLRCKTCGGGLKTCPGHFGYIQLSKPVILTTYASYVYDFLRSFCGGCGRILLPQNKIDSFSEKVSKAKRENNLSELRGLTKTIFTAARKAKVCPYCESNIDTIKLEKPTTFFAGDKRLWPIEIRERLEKIPDDDLEIIGFDPNEARPEWMILTMLLVPPITMRPSITLESGERSEDDLTHKLSDIVRVNQRLLENINAGAPEIIIEDLWDLLQYHISTFFDNSIAQVPVARHKSNRPLKTLAERLKGKEGRFRYNLAGKRVNFCARSVISPDPFIEIDEIGVPKSVALEVTIPETVTEWNIKWLKNFIMNGGKYPGANYVYTEDGKRKKITEETKEQILEELAPGWVVERHLLDNDIALFNRQPSLHRLSMMAHRVKLLPGKTFRINPAVVTPYNADFDGDEMNLHIAQTEESRAEAEKLLLLTNQLITPRYGLSIIGLKQDPIFGLYLLTKELLFTKDDATDILLAAGIEEKLPSPLKKDKGLEYYDGKQIFSMILPKDMNFISEQVISGKKVDFVIKDGILKEGYLTKKYIGAEGGLLIHHMFKHYGSKEAKKLIDTLNLLGLATIRKLGYSLSFYNLDLPDRVKEKINSITDESLKEVDKILKSYETGKIAPLPGKSLLDTAEAKILQALNNARNEVGKIVEKEALDSNELVAMARSGTQGQVLNLALMSGFVGQQALRGERISLGYTNRTLPHFEKGDLGARAHGFVGNGYARGLDPIELFFNAMVGRDSLMDTAMRTPKSGYMQRRLINALQDLKVNYDATVRDSGGKIVQFRFGGDNVDVSKSDRGDINIK